MSRLHFYLANLLSTCLRSSCICGWADYPGSQGSVLSHLAWRNQTGTTRSSHRRRLLIRKPHTFPRKAICLKPARRVYAVYSLPSRENSRWSGAAGFVWNDRKDSLMSSLVTVSRHRQKKKDPKLSDKHWAHICYESLTRLSFFYPLMRMFPHCSVANTNPAVC